MQAFEYRAPSTVEEAVALLAEKNGRARAMAGGTDLLVQLRGGRFELDRVVDVKKIPELNQISYDPATGLTIGAAVPCYRIYEHPQVRALYPALVDATSIIGGIGIQGRATLGGNLCNSSPSGDSIPAMIVLRATCNVAGPNGRRSIPVEQFCTGPGRNALEPGEILISLQFPPPKPNSGAFFLRFIPRNEMDIAVVNAGASVALNADGTVADARVAIGAVAPTPLFVDEAGAALVGKVPTEEAIAEAAERAKGAAKPISDMRGTAEQRKHLSAVLTKRALRGAIQRVKGGNGHAH